MRFELSDTQQLLKSSARKFLQKECPMAEVRRIMETPAPYDANLWRQMAEQGWTGILFAEDYGGMGLGMVETAAMMEEMGRALLPGPFLATVPMAGVLLDTAGNEELKKIYLSRIGSGESRAAVAVQEEDAAWGWQQVQLSASGGGDALRLHGSKRFVQDAGVADFLLVVARGGRGLTLALVERAAEGLSVQPMAGIDLTRRLYSVQCNATPAVLVATGEAAERALERMSLLANAALVAEMLGGMQRVLEISVEYAKTRKQFGKPIGQFQAIQHKCADMVLMVEALRSAAYYAAYAIDHGLEEAQAAVSTAKSYASEAYREVGNHGIQIHGGMGFTWESDLHLYYRRAKASEILLGDAAWHREQIARLVLD
ncbi:MAG: acyl-CoA dehydrogenase [Acidimicrobiia bacterium]|nr:acyl-CoA dehydrogenase [Acidimicrobiia bacterium]